MSECSGPGCPTCKAPSLPPAELIPDVRDVVAKAFAELGISPLKEES